MKKLIIYDPAVSNNEPIVEVELTQFDPTGNPELYFADLGDVLQGSTLRVFVDCDADKSAAPR